MPEPTRITVRPATSADAADIAHLLTALGAPGVDAAEAERRRQRGHEDVLLAVLDGRARGLVAVKTELYFGHAEPLTHITALVTDPDGRRVGLARALVDAADEWARAHGCVGIELTCGLTPAREAAHHFYASRGFERTSYRYWRPLDADPATRPDPDEGTP
jgi:GNAT superfamily N-acetyltransferase